MKILFMPSGKYYLSDKKITILEASKRADVFINAPCGGIGKCGKCKVKINGKSVCACKTYIESDTTVFVDIEGLEKGSIAMPTDLEYERRTDKKYAIAFDIGTTTVAGMLWDFDENKNISTESALNPQSAYGADIMSRIRFCMSDNENVFVLQRKIIECINDMIKKFSIDEEEIAEITVVGNTAESHFFLGINPETLAVYPFKPQFEGMKNILSSDMGINASCNVCLLPNIACHTGSDITADILACDIKKLCGKTVLIDIGTNGEIVFADNGKISVCSTSAGPAFEGAGIKFGMRASEGAIEEIRLTENDIELKIIGNTEPRGICGSGIIDIIAKLTEKGIIDKSGRICDRGELEQKGIKRLSRRVIKTPNGNNFILAYKNNDIILTQGDVRAFQLAKSAIYSGIKTLLNEGGYDIEDIDRLLVAGAFGSHINIESAVMTGLLPNIPREKIKAVGNSAGTGAVMALVSLKAREYCNEIIKGIKHIELSENACFQNEYIGNMNLGE